MGHTLKIDHILRVVQWEKMREFISHFCGNLDGYYHYVCIFRYRGFKYFVILHHPCTSFYHSIKAATVCLS